MTGFNSWWELLRTSSPQLQTRRLSPQQVLIVGLVKGCLLLEWDILAWASLGGTHSFPIETLPQVQPPAWGTVFLRCALALQQRVSCADFVPPRHAELFSLLAVSGG